MSGFSSSLCDGMGDQEEIELSVDDLLLFNESSVNVGTLRGIDDV